MATPEASPDVLASYWNAPTLPGAEPGRPLLCVASTFGLHASLLEGDLLPRFLGLRYDGHEIERAFIVERERRLAEIPVFVLVDSAHVDSRQSTLRWSQLPVRIPTGFQHSKVTFLLWEHAARVIVSSANITRPAYRTKREIAGALEFFDAPSSVPRSLAVEAIAFLETLSSFTLAPPASVDRLLESLRGAKKRIGRWDSARKTFGVRELPRIHFVGGHPASKSGATRRSVMKQVLQLWGGRRAEDIRVVTPFVGEVGSGPNLVACELASVPVSPGAHIDLAVPGHQVEGEEHTTIELPPAFRDGWKAAWAPHSDAQALYVPPMQRKGETVHRELHAKAIYIEAAGEDRVLLLAGSSNFSKHGMGVSVPKPNAEANLVYIGRDQDRLDDCMPIDWGPDYVEHARWVEPPEDTEDNIPAGEQPPPAFGWATHDQVEGVLTIGLVPGEGLPRRWSISLSGAVGAAGLGLGSSTARTPITKNLTIVAGPREELRRRAIGGLKVTWTDGDGASHSATMLVQASGAEGLLPPEELGQLGADRIIEALLTGREAEDYAEGEEARGNGGPAAAAAPESLNAVDTSAYMLYRVRRLGRALAGLGERIKKTTRSAEAMGYRLRHDPLGPLQLAQALQLEWSLDKSDAAELDPVAFGLAEVALTVVRAGVDVVRLRERGEPDLRPLFRNTARDILSSCGLKGSAATKPTVERYVREVRSVLRLHLG